MKRLIKKSNAEGKQLKVQFNCLENETINNIKDKISKQFDNQLLEFSFENEDITSEKCFFNIVFKDCDLSELNECKNLVETILFDFNIKEYKVEIITQ